MVDVGTLGSVTFQVLMPLMETKGVVRRVSKTHVCWRDNFWCDQICTEFRRAGKQMFHAMGSDRGHQVVAYVLI